MSSRTLLVESKELLAKLNRKGWVALKKGKQELSYDLYKKKSIFALLRMDYHHQYLHGHFCALLGI
jgi:hypothetical protein